MEKVIRILYALLEDAKLASQTFLNASNKKVGDARVSVPEETPLDL